MAGIFEQIRMYVFSLSKDQFFSTKDLIGIGKRSTIDNGIARLVKLGIVVRVARGLFVREDFDLSILTIDSIVAAKSKAFGREITPDPDNPGEFLTNGSTSSFDTILGRVIVRGVCPRKMKLARNSLASQLLRVWDDLKWNKSCQRVVACINSLRNSYRQEALGRYLRYLPSWITDQLSMTAEPSSS
ncbi:MAG: hypothetical protein K2Y32_18035 [Candidatus Obscuribacterales bacterium]|nr:hypothetical protein [Candidatus Obscuribacterales bacterium]